VDKQRFTIASGGYTMRAAADVTGGHGFYNNNELADLLQRAAADSSSYYMLGYYLEKGVNPGWRKLKVKGDRAGAQGYSRCGFYATRSEDVPHTHRLSELGGWNCP